MTIIKLEVDGGDLTPSELAILVSEFAVVDWRGAEPLKFAQELCDAVFEVDHNVYEAISQVLSKSLTAENERLREALLRLANAADNVGCAYFDTDTLSDEVQEMQDATLRARAELEGGEG